MHIPRVNNGTVLAVMTLPNSIAEVLRDSIDNVCSRDCRCLGESAREVHSLQSLEPRKPVRKAMIGPSVIGWSGPSI